MLDSNLLGGNLLAKFQHNEPGSSWAVEDNVDIITLSGKESLHYTGIIMKYWKLYYILQRGNPFFGFYVLKIDLKLLLTVEDT